MGEEARGDDAGDPLDWFGDPNSSSDDELTLDGCPTLLPRDWTRVVARGDWAARNDDEAEAFVGPITFTLWSVTAPGKEPTYVLETNWHEVEVNARGRCADPVSEERAVALCLEWGATPDGRLGELVRAAIEQSQRSAVQQLLTRSTASGESPTNESFSHAPDYTWVCWRGQRFDFTGMQAEVIRLLHECQLSGGDALSAAHLLTECESDGKGLRDLFRSKGQYHNAWKVLIVTAPRRRGCYRLAL